MIGLTFAALTGGLAGVAGSLFVVYSQSSPKDVAERLAALEQRTGQSAAAPADVDGLKQQVTGLSGTVSDLNGTVSGLVRDMKAAQDRLQSLPAAAASPSTDASAATSSGAAAPPPAADPQVVAQLTQRLDQVAQKADQAAQLGPQVEQLKSAMSALDQGAGRTANEAMARVDALGQRIAVVESRPADPRVPQMARAVVALDLVNAIDQGRPYATELRALNNAGADAPAVDVSALQKTATQGVATLAELRRDFAAVADKLTVVAASGDGILDRLAASASRVIKIQPVDGEGRPTDPTAGPAARIEAALARGNLAEADAAWQALPQQAQQAAGSFGTKLSDRVAAEQAARTLLAKAMEALAAKPAGTPRANGQAQKEGQAQ